jgi:hypothetical protein
MAGPMTRAAMSGSPSQPWPKLTTLFCTRADVRQGHAGDLFGRRGEGDAVLAAGQLRILLQGDAAQAAGIAGREVGRGASYRPRKKFLPAGQP